MISHVQKQNYKNDENQTKNQNFLKIGDVEMCQVSKQVVSNYNAFRNTSFVVMKLRWSSRQL